MSENKELIKKDNLEKITINKLVDGLTGFINAKKKIMLVRQIGY